MKKKLYAIIIFIMLTFVILLFLFQSNTSHTTMKYFPINKDVQFSNATSNIELLSADTLNWSVSSAMEEPLYLHQDISLLYENGLFKGVQNKWEQNSKQINLSQEVPLHQSSLFESISYHHGEIHDSEGRITSIQHMSATTSYIKKNHGYQLIRNKLKDKALITELDKVSSERMQQKWNELMKHFKLSKKEYYFIPLTKIAQYEDEALPGFKDKDQSDQVIGQLWEGLYKNYILRLKEKENQLKTHVTPLILISKDRTHLVVLFELNDYKEMLMQQFP